MAPICEQCPVLVEMLQSGLDDQHPSARGKDVIPKLLSQPKSVDDEGPKTFSQLDIAVLKEFCSPWGKVMDADIVQGSKDIQGIAVDADEVEAVCAAHCPSAMAELDALSDSQSTGDFVSPGVGSADADIVKGADEVPWTSIDADEVEMMCVAHCPSAL